MTYDPNRPTTYNTTERDNDQEQGTGQDVKAKVQDTAQNVQAKAQQVASDVKDRASEYSAKAAEQADSATTTAGEKLSDVAQTLREKAPATGTAATVADKTADTLDRAGTYLQNQDVADMRADLENIIRRHPMEAMLVGLGIGYLLARSTRR